MRACGYNSRTARSMGVAITASPTQLGWTMRIFVGAGNTGMVAEYNAKRPHLMLAVQMRRILARTGSPELGEQICMPTTTPPKFAMAPDAVDPRKVPQREVYTGAKMPA